MKRIFRKYFWFCAWMLDEKKEVVVKMDSIELGMMVFVAPVIGPIFIVLRVLGYLIRRVVCDRKD